MLHACLAPQADRTVSNSLGRNISPTLQDVEVLCVALREVPTTVERFDELRGSKEWVNVQFAVLGVGPPGWLRAPFLSSNPKKKDADSRPLYETVRAADLERTVFYAFEKGKTGRDRGKRVNVIAHPETGEEVNVSAYLEPGMVLSTFIRNENDFFTSDKIVADGVVPSNSFVFLQVGVTNADQAANGRLLKIKKVKHAPTNQHAATIQACVKALGLIDPNPVALDQHAISAMVMKPDGKSPPPRFVRIEPSSYAKISFDDDSIEFENCCADRGGIKLRHDEAMRATGQTTVERACRLLDIAISMRAVSMLVRSNQQIMDSSWPDEALFINIDVNRLLLLNELADYAEAAENEESFRTMDKVVVNDRLDEIVWGSPKIVLQGERLFFVLTKNAQTLREPWNAEASGFFSEGSPGQHFPLKIMKCRCENLADVIDIASGKLVMNIQLRPSLSGGGSKRKRPALVADACDTCEYEPMDG